MLPLQNSTPVRLMWLTWVAACLQELAAGGPVCQLQGLAASCCICWQDSFASLSASMEVWLLFGIALLASL